MHVVHEKDTIAEAGEKLFHPLFIELLSRACRCAFQSFQHAGLVSFGLQTSDEPSAGIRQAFVVQIDGVLRRQYDTQTERAGLLQQREQGLLRRRIGDRREVAEDFVHVENGAEAGGSGLRPYPAKRLTQKQSDKKHALRIVEMRDRENGEPRFPSRRMEHLADIERFAF